MPAGSTPPIRTAPELGVSMVARRFRSVDLPLPEGPMTPTNSPATTLRSNASSATCAAPAALER